MNSSLLRPSSVQSSQVQLSPVKSCPVLSSPVKSSQVQSSPFKSRQVQSSPVKSSQVHSGPFKSTQVHSGPLKSSKGILIKKQTNKQINKQKISSVQSCQSYKKGLFSSLKSTLVKKRFVNKETKKYTKKSVQISLVL